MSDELLRSIKFLLEHQDINIQDASDLERWKKIAPVSLHEQLERQLAFKSMSIREKIDYLEASNEQLREATERIKTINGEQSEEIDIDTLRAALRSEIKHSL